MRHRVQDKKFNRDANARKALFTGLLRNLTEHGEITTTLARAKVVKRMADGLVARAKSDTLATRRELHKVFGKRDVVNTLVHQVAPAMSDRTSGFVRVVAIGSRRGDNTAMAKVMFVTKPEHKGLSNPKPATKPARAAASKKTVAKEAPTKAAKKAPAKSVKVAKPKAKK